MVKFWKRKVDGFLKGEGSAGLSETALEEGLVRHGSYRRADPYSYRVAYRRLVTMFRISVGWNVCLMLMMVMMFALFTELLPLKEIRYAFLKMEASDDRIVRVEPIDSTIQGFDRLVEQISSRVVRLLLAVDGTSQEQRMGEVYPYLDASYAARFNRDRGNFIVEEIKDGLVRSIVVESATLSERVGKTWRVTVDFVQIDEIEGESKRRPLRAYLKGTTRLQEIKAGEIIRNPLGVTVLDLTIKHRKATFRN